MTQQPTADRDDRLDNLWRPAPRPAAGLDLTGGPHETSTRGPGSGEPPVRRRFGRVFGELVIATVLSFATAAAMGWRILQAPTTRIPGDGADPFIEIWSLAWSGHALRPSSGIPLSQVFDGNIFYPAQYSLAFTDSLLGYGPFTWFFHGVTGLVLAYNLIFVFLPAVSALGGYALARQLGANTIGAAVLAAGFAYAPWRTAHFSHVHVLTTGPLVIALAMLARGHGFTMSGRRTPIRPLWVLLGWLFGAWQLSIGFAEGLPFAYLMVVIAVLVVLIAPIRLIRRRRANRRDGDVTAELPVDEPTPESGSRGRFRSRSRLRDRPRRWRWLVLAELVGGAVFTAAGVLMAYPYFRVQEIDPKAVLAARSLRAVAYFSPTPRGLLTPPAFPGTWSWLTSGATLTAGSNEPRVLPGAILIALAGLGLFFSVWRWWWRLALALAAAAVAGLTLGTNFPHAAFPGPDSPFALLWKHAPGWASDRTPGRLITFCVLALGLLAAGLVARLCQWSTSGQRGWSKGLRSVVFLALPILVVLEGYATIPYLPVPPMPRGVAEAQGPMVVLPSNSAHDSTVMFWTAIRGYPEVANGSSGITPTTEIHMRDAMRNFPDATSVAYLRANGFRSVVVLPDPTDDRPWQAASVAPDPALHLTRAALGDSVLYTLGSPSSTTPATPTTATPSASPSPSPAPRLTSSPAPSATKAAKQKAKK